jgi:hypothetical protein
MPCAKSVETGKAHSSFLVKNHREYPVQGSLVCELYEAFPFLHSFITFATQPFDCNFLKLDMKHIHILKKNK